MSLLRIPFILTAAWGLHISVTSPTSTPSKDELAEDISLSERVFRASVLLNAAFNKYSTWALCFCETAAVLAHAYPGHPLARPVLGALTWGNTASAAHIALSPAFLVNWVLVIVGSFVRWACFRALGRHFTFQVALRKEHQLVTWGPYAVVRHPGYSGGSLVLLCISPIVLGAGSWFWECGAWGTWWGKAVAVVPVGLRLYTLYTIVGRTQLEDGVLRKEFGEQWDRWAEEVPWKWVPGIY